MHSNPKILSLCHPTPSESRCTVASTSETLTALHNAPFHYKQPSIAGGSKQFDIMFLLFQQCAYTSVVRCCLATCLWLSFGNGLLHSLAAMLVDPFHSLSVKLSRAEVFLVGCHCELLLFLSSIFCVITQKLSVESSDNHKHKSTCG